MSNLTRVRDEQRRSWDEFAPGWGKWDPLVAQMLGPIGQAVISHLDLDGHENHLDVASGTGHPGLEIAGQLEGQVTLTDLSTGMLDQLRRNATTMGLNTVKVMECSADDLPFSDATFDSISSRLGFMYFPSLSAAAEELARVLKPGGRICLAVWAEPQGNPWATIPMHAIAQEVDLPAPEPDAPGLFRCAQPGQMADLLVAAGLTDVVEQDVRYKADLASAQECWDYMADVAGPIVAAMEALDSAGRDRVTQQVLTELGQFQSGAILKLPLHARCVFGRKPNP